MYTVLNSQLLMPILFLNQPFFTNMIDKIHRSAINPYSYIYIKHIPTTPSANNYIVQTDHSIYVLSKTI